MPSLDDIAAVPPLLEADLVHRPIDLSVSR
jgi:hypothetical protein